MESDAVERSLRGEAPQILGKDEVASSNLASSSIKNPKPLGFGFFICDQARFERLKAARMSAAGEGWTEPLLNRRTFPCADANKSG